MWNIILAIWSRMQFLQSFQCQLFFPTEQVEPPTITSHHQPSRLSTVPTIPCLIHLRTHALELQMKAGLQTPRRLRELASLILSPKKWWYEKLFQLSDLSRTKHVLLALKMLFLHICGHSNLLAGRRCRRSRILSIPVSVWYSSVWWLRLVVQPLETTMTGIWIEFSTKLDHQQLWAHPGKKRKKTKLLSLKFQHCVEIRSNHIILPCMDIS